ncbi:nuclear transport factor 2 family protein [Sphingobium sp. V4]|uniref:nuclear transport factor 2 family protein n=1 Tax=Sphingobium sp. V4 TaxID=3038927 RepID=UPI002557F3B1|nr:nuclear transport factor 2 family protein [Sphingobium sp. V4]WIW89414.1 nuclear transport factor 2 family protein [Sphingobium sp. V4]
MKLSHEDRIEILELASRYNHAADHRDEEAWADLFTEEGSIQVNGNFLCKGKDELLAYIVKAKTMPQKRQHWLNNIVVDEVEQDDRAQLRAYVCCYDITDGGVEAPYMLGEYCDEVVKDAGRWKFGKRRLSVIAGRSAVANLTRPK